MYSKVMDVNGGLGVRKTNILKKMDLQDPINSYSQVVLEHTILCGVSITNDVWSIVKGDKNNKKRTSQN
jgi:hypothetical protein